MPPKLPILVSSAAVSILLAHYTPDYAPGSRLQTFFLVAFNEFIAWATWRVIIYPNFMSPLKGLPEPSGGSWWNGQASKIMAQPSGHPMREWIDEIPNDGLIRYTNWFNSERVLLTNPKTLAEVLSSKNYEFIKPAHFLDIIGRILGIGLLFAEGDEHRTQRKNLMPAFSYRHIKDLYPVFWSKSTEMVERMSTFMQDESVQDGSAANVVEVSDWSSRATLDIIGVAGMGRDFEALKNPDNELNKTYKTIFHPPKSARYLQVAGMFLPRWFLKSLPIKRNDEISEGSALIKQTCRDLIAAKKIRMEKGAADETDILSVALKSGSFEDENLVSQMMTFLYVFKCLLYSLATLTLLPALRDTKLQVRPCNGPSTCCAAIPTYRPVYVRRFMPNCHQYAILRPRLMLLISTTATTSKQYARRLYVCGLLSL
jgi:hypothetical protein